MDGDTWVFYIVVCETIGKAVNLSPEGGCVGTVPYAAICLGLSLCPFVHGPAPTVVGSPGDPRPSGRG